MKKIILIAFFTIFSLQNCFADQLESITLQQAIKAVSLIRQQKTVVLFCGCCDSLPKRIIKVNTANYINKSIKIDGVLQYYVVLNGKDIETNESINEIVDLAYVYIKNNTSSITVGKFLNYKCDPCVENFKWEFDSNIQNTQIGPANNLKADLVIIKNGNYFYGNSFIFKFDGKNINVWIAQTAPINLISRDNFLSFATFSETSIKQQIKSDKKNIEIIRVNELKDRVDATFILNYTNKGIETQTTDNGTTSTMIQDWASLIKTKERF